MRSGAQSVSTEPSAQSTEPAGDASLWPLHCKTHDGTEYRVRPIRPDDAERDRLFLKSLSDTSRYNRMMGLMRDPPAALVNSLVRVDYRRDMALVAVTGDETAETIIGVARYGGNPACCEFAIAVADEWQSHGIGSHLAHLLFEYAKSHGVRRLYGIVFANNSEMLKLADYLQMTVRRSREDDSVVEIWRTL